jgi:copper(I)-binding protein
VVGTGAFHRPVTLIEEAPAVIRGSRKTVANGLLIGALALVIPAAAGCEAGLNAPTLEFHPASTGAHADVNGISLNDVFVLGAPSGSTVPTGGSASLFLSMYNGGANDDTLLSVSAPGAATSVRITGGAVGLPVDGEVNLTGPRPEVILSGLKRPLSGGQSIPVILDFEHAGSISLQVPVQSQSFYFSTYSAPPTVVPTTATAKAKAAATGTATATPTPTSTTASPTPSS